MAHSDTEEVYETTDPGLKQLNLTDALGDTETYEKTIHSGHFMISHVHDESIAERSKDLEDELVPIEEASDYDTVKGSTNDPSFTELFQCMSLVEKYFSTSGKLTSPKWKNFKGIKTFKLKEKIRVNNIIWREWHMQYVKCLPPILCHFSSPLATQSDGNRSSVDGMSGKRNVKVISNDYKKWRHYFNKKVIRKNNMQDVLSSNSPYCEILQRTSENNSKRLTNLGGIVKKSLYQNPPSQLLMDEDILNEFSDTLFMPSFLMEGSNLREIPSFSDENFNDMMQDSCLNDMDTLEPLQNIFRCESLNFNKVYSTPNVQPSTMLNNARHQNVCDANQPNMESLTLLNVGDALINLPLDLPARGNLVEDKPMDFQTSEQLMSLLVAQQPLNDSRVVNNSPFRDLSVQIGSAAHELENEFVIDGLFNVASNAGPSFNLEVQPSPNIILSNQEASPENVTVGVLYTSNSNNDFQANHNTQSMPLLTGLLQQQKQPMIIQLPPGYHIITPHEVVSHENARIESTNFVNFGNNLSNMPVQLQTKVKSPPSQTGSKSLGCLQVIQNLKENRRKNNSSTGSLITKTTAGFRIPQQQMKCRQKSSNMVNIQPRPHLSSISTSRSSVKQLLPSKSPLTLQTQSPCTANQLGHLKPVENGPVGYSLGGSLSGTKSEKRGRIRNERTLSSLTDKKNDKPSNDHFSAIFQPINPISNTSLQAQSSNTNSYSATMQNFFGGAEQQVDLNATNYSLDNPVGFNEVGRLFKMPDRSRHASNDSGSSHCEDALGFTIGSNKLVNKDLRRISHLTSEQKRRFSIKCGLDTLNELVPGLEASNGSRISKATTLHKAAEYCRKLKASKQELQEEIDKVRNEIYINEQAIKNAHSKMPVQGLPSSGSRTHANQMKAWFQTFLLQRSQDNWKYWIFGSIIEPLFCTFEDVVTMSSVDQFRHSILRWLTEHCSLIILRPIVSNSLRKLSTSTCILVNPDGFQNQVVKKINSSMTQNPLHL